MDRRTALERLDAVRDSADDLEMPELAGVADLLRADRDLAIEFERRQEWDRSIRAAMLDVPVPAGLRERLTNGLTSSESRSVRRSQGLTRRQVVAIVSSVAASVFAAGLFWAFTGQAEPVAISDVRDAAGTLLADSAAAREFQGDFEPRLPAGVVGSRLRFREPPAGLLDDRVAAWSFTTRGARPVRGVLAVLPVTGVTTIPEADSIFDRGYEGAAGNAVAWSDGEFVYVCCVDGGIEELLKRLAEAPIA